jgi:hypothetical protein
VGSRSNLLDDRERNCIDIATSLNANPPAIAICPASLAITVELRPVASARFAAELPVISDFSTISANPSRN